jgi:hypothetical protein
MRRILITWLAICGVLLGAWQASASMLSPIVMFGKPRVANNLSIDAGVAGTCSTSGTTGTATLSTTLTNDIIVVGAVSNVGGASATNPVVDTAALTWTSRYNASGSSQIYWAKAASTLSSDVITYTNNGSASILQVFALAIHGANLTSPFDPNGALPHRVATGDTSVTTTNNFTVPLAVYSMSSTGSPTAGSGFTGLSHSGCFSIMEYKIVSTPQTALDMALTTGVGNQNGGVGMRLHSEVLSATNGWNI